MFFLQNFDSMLFDDAGYTFVIRQLSSPENTNSLANTKISCKYNMLYDNASYTYVMRKTVE